ncbi:MAG: amidohydrolase [Betaproteobacteria bacterium]|nr:MAG: amidohydrolase [Betaproteobacteria bacterium]
MYRCAPATSGSGKIVKKRGKSLRVDIHCHYLNTEAAAAVARHNPAQFDFLARFSNQLTREVNAKQIQERAAKLTSIGQRLKDMDRMGIDVQAVSPAPHQTYYWCEPGEGAELARTVNERIAEIAAQWPERFVGLGSVPLQDAGLAVSELDYCVKQLGLRGVEINPSVNGLDLTDAKLGLDKFFSKVQDLDVLIFMHPVGFTHGERLADHYFNNVIGNPLETTVAASHLIFDGVMERYPKLKILLPHGGGYLRVSIKRKPSSYLEKFYFDCLTFDPGMLHHLVERFGADHVLLGTDYPYDMGVEDPVGFIGGVRKLSSLEKRQIMGGNAARLLKIDYNNRTRRRS